MKIKILNLAILLPLLLLMACNSNEEKSDAYGNFESTEITVSAQASGEIMQFDLEEGNMLNAGQIIGWIDTTTLSLKKQQLKAQRQAVSSKIPNLQAQIAVYNQQKKNVVRDLDRVKKMLDEGAATQKQADDMAGQIEVIDKQILAVKSQESAVYSEINSIDKQKDQLNEAISKSVIINPTKGTILTKYVNAHEIAGSGKPLYKIADLTEMKLKVYVSGDQLPSVKIGNVAEVLIDKNATEKTRLTGKVSWISESAEFTPKIIQTKEERVNLVYAVKVLVKNDGSLKIGMPGEVNF
ncbi:MAG: HlyD family efflux transporter periplasmic adaptor subunit [Bacteroidales bacterium]|nr:HlyD family efflux transporter periplasmic adaptor subunit [Bacteroidales bacterium]